jgi:S1-C subfamily serine protease
MIDALTLFLAFLSPPSHESTVANAARTSVWVGVRVKESPTEAYQQITADSPNGQAKEETHEDGGMCSGFVADDRPADVKPGWATTEPDTLLIVTAKHCTGSTMNSFLGIDLMLVTLTPTDVHFYDGAVGDIDGIYVDPVADVAILRVHLYGKHEPVAYTRKAAPVGGERMFAWGSPQNQYFTYSEVIAMGQTLNEKIIGLDEDDKRILDEEAGDWLVSCASCSAGISGGPVFDYHGLVVGTYVATLDGGIGMIVPGPTILRTLQTATFK